MGLQARLFKRSETVEVIINNVASSQFKFSDNETALKGVKVYAVAIHTESLVKSFTGRTILSNAIQKKGFLTLALANNDQPIKRLPLETFFNDQKFMIEVDGIEVDVRNSFIELQDRTGVVVDECFVVTFFYEPPAS